MVMVRQSGGALGAEIEGVDLSRALDAKEFDAVERAFLDNQVVVLRVGLVGLLLERRLLVRVGGVPLLEERPDGVGVVLALDVGDRTPSGGALAGTATARLPATTAGCQEHDGRDRRHHGHERASSAHIDSLLCVEPLTGG